MEGPGDHACGQDYDVTYVDAGLEDGEPIYFEILACRCGAARFEFKRRGTPPAPPPPEGG